MTTSFPSQTSFVDDRFISSRTPYTNKALISNSQLRREAIVGMASGYYSPGGLATTLTWT